MTTDDYRRLSDEVLVALRTDHPAASAYYYREAAHIGAALDEAQEIFPDHDGPLDAQTRERAEAAEFLGRAFAELASYVLTGHRPPGSDRIATPTPGANRGAGQ